jgi:hypothetical protein
MPIFADSDLAMCEVFKIKTLLSKVGSQRIFDFKKAHMRMKANVDKISPHFVPRDRFSKSSANPQRALAEFHLLVMSGDNFPSHRLFQNLILPLKFTIYFWPAADFISKPNVSTGALLMISLR